MAAFEKYSLLFGISVCLANDYLTSVRDGLSYKQIREKGPEAEILVPTNLMNGVEHLLWGLNGGATGQLRNIDPPKIGWNKDVIDQAREFLNKNYPNWETDFKFD